MPNASWPPMPNCKGRSPAQASQFRTPSFKGIVGADEQLTSACATRPFTPNKGEAMPPLERKWRNLGKDRFVDAVPS